MTPEEEQARENFPTCTCGYWANPIHARQIAVLGVRLARAERAARIWKKMAKGLYALASQLDAMIMHDENPTLDGVPLCVACNIHPQDPACNGLCHACDRDEGLDATDG